jgi:hypothetical protein
MTTKTITTPDMADLVREAARAGMWKMTHDSGPGADGRMLVFELESPATQQIQVYFDTRGWISGGQVKNLDNGMVKKIAGYGGRAAKVFRTLEAFRIGYHGLDF